MTMSDDDELPTALDRAVGYLRCPICGEGLIVASGSVRCASGHSFDIARQGYVSFLTGDAGASTADTAEMVAARARFLGSGAYDAISDAVIAAAPADVAGLALEIGGGTGFYLDRLLRARPDLLGIDLDLSARALRVAARANPRLAAVAGDAWRPLPVQDAAVGVVLSIFSPRTASEIARVLDPAGVLIVVTPTTRHLAELVSALGLITVDERKTERLEHQFAGFELLSLVRVEYGVELDPDRLRDVVLMGPSARHVDRARLDDLPHETRVTVSVEIRSLSPRVEPPLVEPPRVEPPGAQPSG